MVLRRDPKALSPADYLTVIYQAEFDRRRTTALRVAELDPTEALLAADDAQFRRKGAAGDVVPIQIDDHGMRELIAAFTEVLRTQV